MIALKNIVTLSIRCSSLQNKVSRQLATTIIPVNRCVLELSEQKIASPWCRCPVYSNVHTHAKEDESGGIWSRFKKTLGIQRKLKYKKSHLNITGTKMYLWFSKQVDQVEIMKDLELPDTFNSWFLVTELHMWILMNRLSSMDIEGRLVRNGLIRSLWTDVDVRTKSLKGFGLSAKRKEGIEHFQIHMYDALVSYDEGILGHDRELSAAIWRVLFEHREIDPEKLSTVVEYVRKQVKHLDDQDSEVILSSGMVQLLPFFTDRQPIDLSNIYSEESVNKNS